VWSYVVNNYLLGKEPPAFDVLFWNHDTVRLAAACTATSSGSASRTRSPARRPRGARQPGRPRRRERRQLHRRRLTDHIIPWENAYRSTQLLGGEPRFVLSTSGHIQALVNPPAPDSRSSFRVAETYPPSADAWLEQATTVPGSWWPDYDQWLAARSGELKRAPRHLGNARHKAQAKAPGSYVHAA
jgi:polyhydroxyalkanoate synthase